MPRPSDHAAPEGARAHLGAAASALALVLGPLLAACSDGTVEARRGGLSFVDIAPEAGVKVVNRSGDPRRWYIPESNGCGAAWLDHDSDGDVDLFVANGAGLEYQDDGRRLEIVRDAASRLYENRTHDGELSFRDISSRSGLLRTEWINGVAVGDVDNDGDPDLYLACLQADVMLWNDDGVFEAETEARGLGNELWGAAATFADADNDGHLDLYVANYCLFDPLAPPLEGKRQVIEGVEVAWGPEEENEQGANVGAPDRFWRNDGAGSFVAATRDAGFELEKDLCSYAAVFSDVDGDGWQDLLVANDIQPCNLFYNAPAEDGAPSAGGRRFRDEGIARGFAFDAKGTPTGAMGLAVDDFDGDGDFDVFKTNFDFEANGLYVNDGTGHFHERAGLHGLAQPSMDRLAWGCGFFDAELDGDRDLFVANGHVYPQAEEIGMAPWLQRSQLFEAEPGAPGTLRYVDATDRAGSVLALRRSARGAAFGDPDQDGDVDIVVIDIDSPPRLLENRSARRGRWLAVRTIGTVSNRDGYGAVVTVRAGGRSWVREVRTTQGLYSADDPRLHFGLGPVDSIDEVVVRWPSGRTSRVEDVSLDRLLTLREPEESEENVTR